MNLVLSDRNLSLPWEEFPGTVFIDLSKLQIANCIGCFGCWTKTPGRCVIRDDAVKVYPLIAANERILYVSRVRYGGYDTVMKTILSGASRYSSRLSVCSMAKRIISSAMWPKRRPRSSVMGISPPRTGRSSAA